MRTANPALSDKVFQIEADASSTTMTLEGTAMKTMVLLGIVVFTAAFVWIQTLPALEAAGAEVVERAGHIRSLSAMPGATWGYMMGGAIGGLVLAMITIFFPKASPISAPIYAALEGLFLGAFSAMCEFMYPGVIPQAVTLTLGVFGSLLLAYQFRLIRATENFKLGVFAATGGICLAYFAGFILSFFGVSIPLIHETGLVGIGFSLFVVVIAAMNLVLDFDFIETGVERGAPKYMEWYAGFGLLVTLIWLYIEIVRLLMKLRSRN